MALNQERVVEPSIRSVYNGTGSTIAKGTIVKLKSSPSVPLEIVKAAAATDVLFGVLMADLTDKTYGDCQVRGIAIVLAGGTVAAGVEVASDTNGLGAAAAANNTLLGVAVTDGSNGNFFEVELQIGARAQ